MGAETANVEIFMLDISPRPSLLTDLTLKLYEVFGLSPVNEAVVIVVVT